MAKIVHPDVNRIKYLYINCRKSTIQIAKEIGISRGSVGYYLRRMNYIRNYSEASKLAAREGRKNYPTKIPDLKELAKIRELYENKHFSTHEIGLMYGVTSSTITTNLRKMKCRVRSPSEGRYLAWKQGKFQLPKGKNHHNWKGGSWQRKDGYIMERAPEHPRATASGYVLQHILVWERVHKKSLRNGMHIHHLNGIRNDNRIENLFAVLANKHDRFTLLHAAQNRIKKLESQLEAAKKSPKRGKRLKAVEHEYSI